MRVFHDTVILKMEVGSSCCLNELYIKKPILYTGIGFFGVQYWFKEISLYHD